MCAATHANQAKFVAKKSSFVIVIRPGSHCIPKPSERSRLRPVTESVDSFNFTSSAPYICGLLLSGPLPFNRCVNAKHLDVTLLATYQNKVQVKP